MRLRTGVVVCGLIAGFGAALGALAAVGAGGAGGHHARNTSLAPAAVDAVPDGKPSPAALDAEWPAYSDKSSCADWAGGDGVSAMRLSPSQVAWFFSDSYLGPAGPEIGFSHLSGFVHNVVVVQTTAGRRSTFVTLTGGRACAGPGKPGAATAVVSPPDIAAQRYERYWDADGIRVGQYLLKFYNGYLPGPPPFLPVGTVIAQFAVSQLAQVGHGPAYGRVARPRITSLPVYTPPDGGTPIVWGAALLRQGSTVFVYGWQGVDPRGDGNARRMYLAKVDASRVADMRSWRFYAGGGTWAAGQQNAQPIAQPGNGPAVSTGFSVVLMAGRYWLIEQAAQVGSPDIVAYPAPAPWGPFDVASGILVYRSPDIGLDAAHDYRIMYEARAEPALSDHATLVISYNVNSVAVTAGCVALSAFTNSITQPRFIAVPRAAFSAAGTPLLNGYKVVAGPSAYPAIASKHPSQWFNAWAYPHGCPPVPAMPDVTVRQSGGSVRLSWPSVGIGVKYLVYLRAAGSNRSALVRTSEVPRTALTGLAHGSTYQISIVPVNSKNRTGLGAMATVTVQ